LKCESHGCKEVHAIKYARKKNLSDWRADSAASSSSEPTAPSTPPKDVLELGRYLVDECLGGRNNDTLSRWFLHAIAERLAACDAATNAAQKKQRESEAADLILRLWKHRSVVPMGIDPLAPYGRVFEALRSLLPQANPWRLLDSAANETVAAELYRCLSLLTIAMFLFSVEAIPKRSKSEKALHDVFLPFNEKAILHLFEQVEEFVSPKLNSDTKQEVSKAPKMTQREAAHGVRNLIERTRAALDEALVIVDRAEQGRSRRKVGNLNVSAKTRLKALTPAKKKSSNSKAKKPPPASPGNRTKPKR